MQMMKRGLGLASALVVAWLVAPVQAHHSFAMFDMTKTVVLKGTVTEFQWTRMARAAPRTAIVSNAQIA